MTHQGGKVINPQARCRNCWRTATDRKRQFCQRTCRVVLRSRRATWDRHRARLECAEVITAEVEQYDGSDLTRHLHRIGAAPAIFDAWLQQHSRGELLASLGRRPGWR